MGVICYTCLLEDPVALLSSPVCFTPTTAKSRERSPPSEPLAGHVLKVRLQMSDWRLQVMYYHEYTVL